MKKKMKKKKEKRKEKKGGFYIEFFLIGIRWEHFDWLG